MVYPFSVHNFHFREHVTDEINSSLSDNLKGLFLDSGEKRGLSIWRLQTRGCLWPWTGGGVCSF